MPAKHFFISSKGLADALQRPSAWVLIVVNLGLIAGVIVWDWQVFDIVFLYWAENLVIGAINVLKMLVCNPGNESVTTLRNSKSGKSDKTGDARTAAIANMGGVFKLILIPFFIIHYGGFCFGHGIFIFALFSDGSLTSVDRDTLEAMDLLTGSMLFAIAALAASHLFSFFRNFIAAGEYRSSHPAMLMMRPYGRIVALHITIIVGAFLSIAFGSPMGLLVVLILLKTGVDLAMHQTERRKLQDM